MRRRSKHNEANGENNHDGHGGEVSTNFGIEGPSDDVALRALRLRVRRAMVATLLLAQGTPMLCAGDEIGRTQRGNNNAYCQDNAVSWLDWSHADTEFAAFVASVLALRRSEPALHHDRWFQPPPCSTGERSLSWATPAGREMQLHDWHDAGQHAFTCLIDASQHDAGHGARHHLVIAFNPGAATVPMRLPVGHWQVVLDSSGELALDTVLADNGVFDMPERALVVLREWVHDKSESTAA